MISRLNTYKVVCDNCGVTVVYQSPERLYCSLPAGWARKMVDGYECGHVEYSRAHEYCPDCAAHQSIKGKKRSK